MGISPHTHTHRHCSPLPSILPLSLSRIYCISFLFSSLTLTIPLSPSASHCNRALDEGKSGSYSLPVSARHLRGSCRFCFTKKIKCNGMFPCHQCAKRGEVCEYVERKQRPRKSKHSKSVKKRAQRKQRKEQEQEHEPEQAQAQQEKEVKEQMEQCLGHTTVPMLLSTDDHGDGSSYNYDSTTTIDEEEDVRPAAGYQLQHLRETETDAGNNESLPMPLQDGGGFVDEEQLLMLLRQLHEEEDEEDEEEEDDADREVAMLLHI